MVAFLYWFFGTEIGCALRATGNNEKMSNALGVNTDNMKILALMISNGIVALSGALLAQYQGYADINMGRGAIVIGLASVIIGEVIFGKNANFGVRLAGTVLGGIVYYLIINLVLQAGLSTTDLKLFSALTVAVALSIPNFKKNKAHGGRK